MIHKLQGSINYYNTQQELEGLITWCMIEVVGGEGGGGSRGEGGGGSKCVYGRGELNLKCLVGSMDFTFWLFSCACLDALCHLQACLALQTYTQSYTKAARAAHAKWSLRWHLQRSSRILAQFQCCLVIPAMWWAGYSHSVRLWQSCVLKPCGELVTVILLDCGSLVYSGHVVSCQLVSHSVRRWQSCVTQAMWWAGHSHSVRPWQSCVTPARW